MDAVVIVDVDIAESLQHICFVVERGAVAIKSGEAFFDDHIAGNGFQYGGIRCFLPQVLSLYDPDGAYGVGRCRCVDDLLCREVAAYQDEK